MPKKNQSHLNEDERTRIDVLLREECSIRYIADRLDRSPSTISREINRHAKTISPRCCDCLNSSGCSLRHVCGAPNCHKKCQACAKAKKHCHDYSKAYCDTLLHSPAHLCNACRKQRFCHFEKRIYDPKTAQADYLNLLVNSRNGFDLTASQFQQINDLVSPLVRKGQCETNHKLLREVIPKGTSIDAFMQGHLTLATNHINSYARKSLFGKCPYELAQATLPQDFFLLCWVWNRSRAMK